MVLLTAVALLVVSADKPQCVTSSGITACGYHCIGDSGTAKCAQTPEGVCVSNAGRVVCFDPPNYLVKVLKEVPKATCVTDGTVIACGYNCERTSGKAGCSATPVGVCVAEYGQVVCFDPPDEVFALFGSNPPKPTCLSDNGKTVCGYNCDHGSMGINRCAKTPYGVCKSEGAMGKCFDPSGQVMCANGKGLQKPTCIYEYSQLACGYDCKATSGRVGCAQTPQGKCDTFGEGVTCFDPPIDPGQANSCWAVLGLAGH